MQSKEDSASSPKWRIYTQSINISNNEHIRVIELWKKLLPVYGFIRVELCPKFLPVNHDFVLVNTDDGIKVCHSYIQMFSHRVETFSFDDFQIMLSNLKEGIEAWNKFWKVTEKIDSDEEDDFLLLSHRGCHAIIIATIHE